MDIENVVLLVVLASLVWAAVVYSAAKLSERRNPPIGEFMSVDGVRLHYLVLGEGDPVVLLHGNTTMLQDYLTSGLAEHLAKKHKVVLIDRPGFGYSDRPRGQAWPASRQAELLVRMLQRLHVERATIIGHSWGTLVATAIAEQQPQLVRSLVLMSGFYFPQFRLDALLVAPAAWPVVGDVLRYTVSPLMGALLMPLQLRAMFGPPETPRPFKEQFPLSMMLRPWQIRATSEDGALMVSSARELCPSYSALPMPVLVIAGSDDRVVDWRKQSMRLATDVNAATSDIVQGAGHMVHHTNLDRVATAIGKHLAAVR